MKMPFVVAGALIAGVLLAIPASSRAYEPPLVVSVSRDGDACRVVVLGERVTMDRLVELARPAWKRAIVIYDNETPFRCVAGAIVALQRAGLTRIDAVIWDGSGVR